MKQRFILLFCLLVASTGITLADRIGVQIGDFYYNTWDASKKAEVVSPPGAVYYEYTTYTATGQEVK